MDVSIKEIINEYRKKTIEGTCINLVPLNLNHSADVVEIRNRAKNKYFLNQSYELTIESQENWYEKYLIRTNDIYWCIYNKKNEFIGTIRIYDIDETKELCDQGSFMIDEDHSMEAPYALEAELLTLDFVFQQLKIKNVINEDRSDNKVMNNLTKKLGFKFEKNTVINGIDYNYYLLNFENYQKNRDKLQMVIDYWRNRE